MCDLDWHLADLLKQQEVPTLFRSSLHGQRVGRALGAPIILASDLLLEQNLRRHLLPSEPPRAAAKLTFRANINST
jgi:hypothetical protein